MTCPKCKSQLIDIQAQGSNLHFCGNCRGVWFDSSEFLHHLRAKTGDAKIYWSESASRSTNLRCPHCGSDLKESPFNVCSSSGCAQNTFLLVDFCGHCDGLWLDEGELVKAEQLGKDLLKVKDTIFNNLHDIKETYPYKLRHRYLNLAVPVAAFALLFGFLVLYSRTGLESSQNPQTAHASYGICRECGGSGSHKQACASCRGLGKVTVLNASNAACGLCGGTGRGAINTGRCSKCSGSGWTSGGAETCSRCSGKGKITNIDRKSCGSCYGTGHVQVREVCGVCGGSRKSAINSSLGCPGCSSSGYVMIKRTCSQCLSGTTETRHDQTCQDCSGRGTVLAKHSCDQCMGTGILDASRDSAACLRCSGTGSIAIHGPNTVVCQACGGAGTGSDIACRTCDGKGVRNGV